MDHQGVLRDARTGKAISMEEEREGGGEDEEMREQFGTWQLKCC